MLEHFNAQRYIVKNWGFKTRDTGYTWCIIEEMGAFCTEKRRKDARREAVIVDLDKKQLPSA